MCGRFTLSLSAEELKEALGVEIWEDGDAYVPSWNTAPSMETPVFYGQAGGVLSMMKWGIASSSLFRKPPMPEKILVNIRRETFLSSLASSERCVIPADGYYEWAKSGKISIPYYFSPADALIIFFAGLWYEEKGKKCFAVLTAAAEGEAASVHDRIPVMLGKKQLGPWLDVSSSSALEKILDEAPAHFGRMKFHAVSGLVNNVSQNSPECVKEFKYSEQPDLF